MNTFQKDVLKIAIPVALQSMLQSSFSMVDQIMVGQLGENSIAAVEIAGKPSFIYAFVIGAIGAIAGIMISQYIGKDDREAEEKSICVNSVFMLMVALVFFAMAVLFSAPFVRLFSSDVNVIEEGSNYLRIIGWAFLPLGISNICGVAIRYPYVRIYQVTDDVRVIGAQILLAFAVLMPVKVQNMILGGGIIRSGGRTKYIMMIDMLGTWLVGVPLAIVAGLVWKLPIVWVYFILSQEEVVRFIISIFMFRSKKWMNTIE